MPKRRPPSWPCADERSEWRDRITALHPGRCQGAGRPDRSTGFSEGVRVRGPGPWVRGGLRRPIAFLFGKRGAAGARAVESSRTCFSSTSKRSGALRTIWALTRGPVPAGQSGVLFEMNSNRLSQGIVTRPERTTANTVTKRSWETLETHHLRRLAKIAISDLEDFFRRRSETGDLYRNRRMLLCLCQGGARHFVHQDNGVKDFDVWAFFRENPERPFPYRRRGVQDFGHSRFGCHPDDENYQGRRVDVFGRSLACGDGQRPRACVREWLGRGKTKSSRKIAKSPVVVIHPEADIGRILSNPGPAR